MALVDGHGCTRIARLMAAAAKPELWSELQPKVDASRTIFRWQDGVDLTLGKTYCMVH